MSRDSKLYLRDMLDACNNVIQFTQDLNRDNFAEDPMRLHAILYNIQILGEAAKNIPTEFRDQHPELA